MCRRPAGRPSWSRDGSLARGTPVQIAHYPRAFLCEPGLVRSSDDEQLAVLLRENSRKFNSFMMFSDGEGRTWSKPHELPGALAGDRHVGLTRLTVGCSSLSVIPRMPVRPGVAGSGPTRTSSKAVGASTVSG